MERLRRLRLDPELTQGMIRSAALYGAFVLTRSAPWELWRVAIVANACGLAGGLSTLASSGWSWIHGYRAGWRDAERARTAGGGSSGRGRGGAGDHIVEWL